MLVNCVAYEGGRRIGDVAVADIHSHLSRPDGFIWVALKEPAPEEIAAMQKQFDLHPLAVEDALHGHQRPKVEEYGETVFAVLHLIEPADGDLNVGEVEIFVGRNFVLSVRRGSERGFAELRGRSEREPELLKHGPGYVLYVLMDAVVDRYFPIIDLLESEVEAVEARIFANHTGRDIIEALYGIKRRITTVKHAVGPLLEATTRLFGGRVPHVCGALQDYFRDVHDHLGRLNQALDSLRETVATVLNVHLSLITVQENEVVKRLASYGALLAVPTLIVGVYGMNFEHMPELKWTLGYPAALLLMVVVDLALFRLFRKSKWL